MLARFLIATIGFAALVGTLAPRGHNATPSAATEGVKDVVLYRHNDGHFYADAKVNGTLVHFLVDTGASTVALTASDARKAGLSVDEANFAPVGSGASGMVKGQRVMLSSIALEGKRVEDVSAVVLADDLDVSLLGQAFLKRIQSVNIADDEMRLH
jgi:aspartyl protease family protein